ncbi:hypothetical protein [Burkholderia ambifaria]|uniref:hypothetical protein n=2 Tax=Burkholderia ambifaria TaxID=152480 RepID=UPI00158C60E4|nr:hypothetical protein [Burkholderia ambifaria]MBR8184150.1 hypothetical protein [Burkholderia ambifaria]
MQVGDRYDVRRSPYAKACGDFYCAAQSARGEVALCGCGVTLVRIRCCGPFMRTEGSLRAFAARSFAALRLAEVSCHERGDRSRRVAGQLAAACAAIERHLGTTLLPMHLFG